MSNEEVEILNIVVFCIRETKPVPAKIVQEKRYLN